MSKSNDGKGRSMLATTHLLVPVRARLDHWPLLQPRLTHCILLFPKGLQHQIKTTCPIALLALLTLRNLGCSTQLSLRSSFLRLGFRDTPGHGEPCRALHQYDLTHTRQNCTRLSYRAGTGPPLSMPYSLGLWKSCDSLQSFWHLPFIALLTC